MSPDCKLFPPMGHIPGFSIYLFEITIKKHVLNRELAVGTQIGFRSNCDLKFRTIYGSFAPVERSRYSYVTRILTDVHTW